MPLSYRFCHFEAVILHFAETIFQWWMGFHILVEDFPYEILESQYELVVREEGI